MEICIPHLVDLYVGAGTYEGCGIQKPPRHGSAWPLWRRVPELVTHSPSDSICPAVLIYILLSAPPPQYLLWPLWAETLGLSPGVLGLTASRPGTHCTPVCPASRLFFNLLKDGERIPQPVWLHQCSSWSSSSSDCVCKAQTAA